jgi:hypothetical protein
VRPFGENTFNSSRTFGEDRALTLPTRMDCAHAACAVDGLNPAVFGTKTDQLDPLAPISVYFPASPDGESEAVDGAQRRAMDSAHRHQLQQNDLGQLTMRVVPWFERYGVPLIGVLVAVIVATILGALWMQSSAGAQAAAWTRLSSAKTSEEFASIAEQYPDTLAGSWAKLQESELHLESGILGCFQDRALADKDLKRAEEGFQSVLKSKAELPDALKERAMYGLGQALESQSDGDTAAAVTAYEQLLQQFPQTVYRVRAEAQIATLKTGGASDFYRWFRKENPKPAEFARPKDGSPGAAGGLQLPGLPPSPGGAGATSVPPLTTPPPPASGETPAATGAPEKPVESTGDAATPEAPAEPAAPPAADSPAGDAQAADNPAAETPAAEKPATDSAPESPATP